MKKQEEIEKCKKNYSTIGFIVAEVDKKVVGFCGYKDMENKTNEDNDIDCEIKALYVKSEHKRNGIGRKLLDNIKEIAKKENCDNIELNCWSFNKRAMKFYRDYGMKEQRVFFELNVEEE